MVDKKYSDDRVRTLTAPYWIGSYSLGEAMIIVQAKLAEA